MTIGAIGFQREGKTLTLVAHALLFQQYCWQELGMVVQIYCNFPCSFDYIHFENWEELRDIKDAIVIFDEIDTAIDSRNTKSKDQLRFTHWFKQNGKRGITLMYTAQMFSLVELRVRQQTDYVFECQKDFVNGYLIQRLWDKRSVPELEGSILRRRYINTKPSVFYGLYNSFAIVQTTLKD